MFAPPGFAAFITWMQGWVTVFAWQATATSVVYLTATQIQGLMILNYETYTPKRWHGTLLMWAVTAVMFVTNVWGIRLLPIIELIAGICHVLFFIMTLITLVVLVPHSSPKFVFTDFINGGGWSSDGLSWCIGLLTVVYCFVGEPSANSQIPSLVTDSSQGSTAQSICKATRILHNDSVERTKLKDLPFPRSEEVKDSATTVPKVIILTIAINSVLAFGFLIALLFCIGNLPMDLNTRTGYPIIAIYQQATGSKAAATALEAGVIIIAFASGFALLASVSRLTFAFARDGGMPFSNFFAYVSDTPCAVIGK